MKRILLVSVMLVVLLLSACGAPSTTPTPTPKADPEREAIITFTRQALAIEAQRDELLNLGYASPVAVRLFLRGASVNGVDLPGARELKNKMLLLDLPPSLQGIKDSLVEAYRLEIEVADSAAQIDLGSSSSVYFPRSINRFNVDSYKKVGNIRIDNSWVSAQELRRDVYTRWSQILKDHGIDPAKEGFTALVLKQQ